MAQIAEMVPAGLITIEDIQIYQYSSILREGFPDVKVEQIMKRDVATVSPEATLVEAVEKLLDKPYSALPVVNAAGELVGIISDTDLLERGDMEISLSLGRATDPEFARSLISRLRQNGRTVADVMTPDPVTVGPTTSLSEAARAMGKKNLKRLPVVNADKQVVGMLSRFDILTTLAAGYLPQLASRNETGHPSAVSQTVADVMERAVSAVLPETLLTDVLALLTADRSQRVIVVDADRHVVGIISDTDLLARLSPETHPGILGAAGQQIAFGPSQRGSAQPSTKSRGKTAAHLMTAPVITLRP